MGFGFFMPLCAFNIGVYIYERLISESMSLVFAWVSRLMKDRYVKWLIYTVIVGLIPIMVRLLVCAITNSDSLSSLVPSDVIVFGLVLHISILNEIEHVFDSDGWKTKQVGISIVFMVMYSILMAALLFSEVHPAIIDMEALLNSSVAMAIISFVLTSSVFYRGQTLPSARRASV